MSGHKHDHNHVHEHPLEMGDSQKTLIVLKYMLDHNRHHSEELHEIADSIEGDAAKLLYDAVDAFEQGNDKLAAAIQVLE